MWNQHFGGRRWRLTENGVVTIQDGAERLWRTPGRPRTMRVYLAAWIDELTSAARAERVPISLLLMTLATENGPRAIGDELVSIPVRLEPGWTSDEETPHRISVGPSHVLIATAREVMDDPTIDRAWLQVVGNNIRAAARYLRRRWESHQGDPVLAAAVYNAGSLRRDTGNPWHLRSYGNHLDRAAAWYGDACAALLEAGQLLELDRTGLGRSHTSEAP